MPEAQEKTETQRREELLKTMSQDFFDLLEGKGVSLAHSEALAKKGLTSVEKFGLVGSADTHAIALPPNLDSKIRFCCT